MAMQGSGQTLENLFINVASRYSGGEQMRRADKDIDKIDRRVEKLGNTLAKVGAAFAIFATASVKAFSENERAMSEFAGKAGLHLTEFEKKFGKMSKRIARQTGLNRAIILQGLQEGFSMGLTQKQLDSLAPVAARLHAGNQSDMRTSLTAAAQAFEAGFGSPANALITTYAAAQQGAGAVADYGQVFKKVAPFAGQAGVGMNLIDTLSTLALLAGQAESLSMGGTWMRSWLITMLNPKKEAIGLLESRTGKTFGELRSMMSEEGGIVEVVKILKQFKPEEIFKLFGREEAASFVNAINPDSLAEKIGQVIEKRESGPVREFWSHFSDTLSRAWGSFSEALNRFLESFGAPIVFLLKRFMEIGGFLLDALTALNKYTFGLIGAITTLVGSLGLAVVAFKAARFLLGGAILDGIGNAIGTAVGNAMGGTGTAGPKAKGSNLGLWATIGNILITVLAFFTNIKTNIMAMFAQFKTARSMYSILRNMNSPGHFITSLNTAFKDRIVQSGGKGAWRMLVVMHKIQPVILAIKGLMLKMLTGTNIIAAGITALIGLFTWFTRGTDAARRAREKVAARRRLRSHFEAGGALDDTAPLPGEFDSLDIQTEQAEVLATARRKSFFRQFIDRELAAISGAWNWIGSWINVALDTFMPNLRLTIDTKLAAAWDGFVEWLHSLFTSPLDFIIRYNKEQALKRQRVAAERWGWLLEKLGFADPVAGMDPLIDPTAEGTTPITTLPLTAEEAKRLGLAGMPGSYAGSADIIPRRALSVPSLPVPRIDALNSINAAELSRLSDKGHPVNITNNFTINGATDPEEVAKVVQRQHTRAIWEAIENAESPLAP